MLLFFKNGDDLATGAIRYKYIRHCLVPIVL